MYTTLEQTLGQTGLMALVGILTFIFIFCVLYVLITPITGPSGAARIKSDSKDGGKKVKGVDKRKEIQEQLRRQEELRKQTAKVPMVILMERAGMKGTPTQLYVKFAIIGCLVAGALAFAGLPVLYVFGIIPPVFAILLPKKVVNFRINRLQKKFVAEFPNAIDILVRGVRTGLPVNEGMRVISREIPEPVATEFRLITDSTAVGVTLDDALQRFFNRMPLSEVNFFNIVLSIQKQTGGNLSEALGNLSNTLRERKKLKNKIKALSSEAKASAMIIGSLPFLLASVLFVIAPDLITLLFTTTTGNYMIAGGLFWMGCGCFVMKTMMDFEI